MNFRKRQPDDELEINLIPLIDVLLVILIFLAATTSFNRYQQLQLTLPRASAEAMQPDALRLAIGQDGLYAVEGQLLPGTTVADITDALRQARGALSATADDAASLRLIIDADARAPHAAVVRAMEAARLTGIERVHFSTQAAQ